MLRLHCVTTVVLGLVLATQIAPACAASGSSATSAQERAQERAVVLREDWVDADLRLVDAMLAASRETGASLDAVLAHFASASTGSREDRDLGFGARRSTFGVGGGYASVQACMVVTAPEDEPAELVVLDLELRCSIEAFPRLSERIAKRLGPPTDVAARVWKLERQGDAGRRAVVARIERQLGSAGEVNVPAELSAAFEMLTSPSESLMLGTGCGFAGIPPRGCSEMRALVAAGRHDLVRAVLRGLNPEGRAWAAHALLRRKAEGAALDPADERAIERLSRLPLDLATCDGCIGGRARFREAIASLAK